LELAFEVAKQAVASARLAGDGSTLGFALRQFSQHATRLISFDEAEMALTEAEAIPGSKPQLHVQLLQTRLLLTQMRGNLESAAHMCEQLRREYRSLGDTRGDCGAAINLANVEYDRGQPKRSVALAHEILPAARASHDTDLLSLVLSNLAGYLLAVDDLSGAAAAARELLGLYATREPDNVDAVLGLEYLALIHALRGDLICGATLQGYADSMLRRHGYERDSLEKSASERLNGVLHERIATDERERFAAEGAALTHDAAIALALEALTPPLDPR
jgi:ATP/maltotriose-dependent transcriptional regulator MalT